VQTEIRAGETVGPPLGGPTLVHVERLSRRFGATKALENVSLSVDAGSIHALLGPNGAGKTTLVRTLSGLVQPGSGTVRVAGIDAARNPRALRTVVGLVASGDRTFYLRISGFENLLFFGRLHGLSRRQAAARAAQALADVGLADAADTPVGVYSHGMQKRLSFARALLHRPSILLVDEATHDLDPEGARRIVDLASSAAAGGAAIVWATQRLDELRGFASRVTILREGTVRFEGTVPQLASTLPPRRYVLRLGRAGAPVQPAAVGAALDGVAVLLPSDLADGQHVLMALEDDVVLGDALAALVVEGIDVLACRHERSELEEAFLELTRKDVA
jgi:ABC-2 type transport system ATP-binding protein